MQLSAPSCVSSKAGNVDAEPPEADLRTEGRGSKLSQRRDLSPRDPQTRPAMRRRPLSPVLNIGQPLRSRVKLLWSAPVVLRNGKAMWLLHRHQGVLFLSVIVLTARGGRTERLPAPIRVGPQAGGEQAHGKTKPTRRSPPERLGCRPRRRSQAHFGPHNPARRHRRCARNRPEPRKRAAHPRTERSDPRA